MQTRQWLLWIQDLRLRYQRHHITAFSAQMAYFFMLSIFPMLIFVLMVGARLDVVISLQQNEIFLNIPKEIQEFLTGFVNQMKYANGNAVLSVAGVGTLYAASRAVIALQRAMNAVYEIEETRSFIETRLTGMLYTFLLTLMIIITLLMPNIGYRAVEWLQAILPIKLDIGLIGLWSLVRMIVLAALYILLFGSIYSLLPNKRIRYRDAYYGAIFALVGTVLENIAFSTIVSRLTNYAVLYGSLSVVIVFMIWLYVLGIIIMIGAEINAMIWAYQSSPPVDLKSAVKKEKR
jgi:membrane protein